MPAKSQAQQKFMGMVHAYKKGDMSDASPEVKKTAASMSGKDAEKYASTSHTGLPKKMHKENTLGQIIGQYNSYGAKLRSELSMRELAEELMQVAEFAEQAVMSEADDWFDGHTIKRNMKEMKNYVKEFAKVANEYDAMRQRATALYDDVGRVLERYFEIREDDDYDGEEYDTDGDGLPDLKAGNSDRSPVNGGQATPAPTMHEDDDFADLGVEKKDRAKDLTERLVSLARHRLTGEQLARFDTLKKETQIKAAWRIVR
jgi:hypothetical protein